MPGKLPTYYDAGPFSLCPVFPSEHVKQALVYKHQPDDLFIATFPKNGTTWSQQIVYSILNNGDYGGAQAIDNSFLEMAGSDNVPRTTTGRTMIKTHLRLDLIQDNLNPQAKYIVILRNPKDTCVSYYHHHRMFSFYDFTEGDFNDFYRLFADGKNEFGDYFHWISAAMRYVNHDNFLFLTYESMKKDIAAAIGKIADFMSTDDEHDYVKRWNEDHEYRQRILHHCSLSYMKKHLNPDMTQVLKQQFEADTGSEVEFVRKGSVNAWHQVMSLDQSERLSAKFKETASLHPQLMSMWQDYSWL